MAVLLGITQNVLLFLVLPVLGTGNMQITFSQSKQQNSRQMVCGTKGGQEMFALWNSLSSLYTHRHICRHTHIYTYIDNHTYLLASCQRSKIHVHLHNHVIHAALSYPLLGDNPTRSLHHFLPGCHIFSWYQKVNK